MWGCFRRLKNNEPSKDLEHNNRRREVEGCVKCGREIRPGNQVMVCSMRFERWTVCLKCYRRKRGEFKTPMYSEKVLWEVDPGPALRTCSTVSSALKALFDVYRDRPCLGFPTSILKDVESGKGSMVNHDKKRSSKNTFNDYSWFSYEEVGNIASSIGRGIQILLSKEYRKGMDVFSAGGCSEDESDNSNLDLKNHSLALPSGERPSTYTVLLYAEASVEWYLMQYGCVLAGLLIVPILDGTPKHQLKEIMDKCLPSIIITCTTKYDTVKSILDLNFNDNKTNHFQPKTNTFINFKYSYCLPRF